MLQDGSNIIVFYIFILVITHGKKYFKWFQERTYSDVTNFFVIGHIGGNLIFFTKKKKNINLRLVHKINLGEFLKLKFVKFTI